MWERILSAGRWKGLESLEIVSIEPTVDTTETLRGHVMMKNKSISMRSLEKALNIFFFHV